MEQGGSLKPRNGASFAYCVSRLPAYWTDTQEKQIKILNNFQILTKYNSFIPCGRNRNRRLK